jgi:EpsG family
MAKLNRFAFLSFVILLAFMLLISPFGVFIVSMFALLNVSDFNNRFNRMTIGVVASVAISIIAASRIIDLDDANDVIVYYGVYLKLVDNDWSAFAHFAGGIEFALPLLMWLLSLLLPVLTISGLMFAFSLICMLLFVAWIEYSFIASKKINITELLGISMLMVNVYFSTQLTRQFFALIILLFAISATTRVYKILFLLISSSFHLSALPFYLIYVLVSKVKWGLCILFIFVLLLQICFPLIVKMYEFLPFALGEKVLTYVINESDITDVDIASLRITFLLIIIATLSFFSSRLTFRRSINDWALISFSAFAIQLMLLPIPLASLRFTLLINSILPGFIAYHLLISYESRLKNLVLNGLLIYKSFILAFSTAYLSFDLGYRVFSGFLI